MEQTNSENACLIKDNIPSESIQKAYPLYTAKYRSHDAFADGYTPEQIKRAYNINSCYTGKRQTIAVVSAFDAANLITSMGVFCRQFHYAAPDIKVIYAGGTTPPSDETWAMQTFYSVQWIHALASSAKIIVVLAASDSLVDLYQAVDVANLTGANIVCLGWGTDEWPGETDFEKHFKSPGIVYVAGAGDTAGKPLYPSVSQNVLSVGGTKLELNYSGDRILPEIVWSNTGGGPSRFIPIPRWQAQMKSVAEKCGGYRGTPDVAFVGDETTGLAASSSGSIMSVLPPVWRVVGGTGMGAACWSAIAALMSEKHKFSSSADFIEFLYTLAGKTGYVKPQYCFRDITDGTNGVYSAANGWDFCTGLGTPIKSHLP